MDQDVARVAIVTGVSRCEGIGFAVAKRLLRDHFNVLIHSWSAHDADQPWSPAPGELQRVIDRLGGIGPGLDHVELDFADPGAPRALIEHAVGRFGAVDAIIANHAVSLSGGLTELTAAELDLAWAVNARASVLLAQAFAERHDGSRAHGRVVLFTSGQHLGPMADELAYAISKGAIHQMTVSLADALGDRAITVNAINPGPCDTGWPDQELRERLRPRFPAGRWGQPEDIAGVVGWLVSADSAWVTGQVINAEGGFRR